MNFELEMGTHRTCFCGVIYVIHIQYTSHSPTQHHFHWSPILNSMFWYIRAQLYSCSESTFNFGAHSTLMHANFFMCTDSCDLCYLRSVFKPLTLLWSWKSCARPLLVVGKPCRRQRLSGVRWLFAVFHPLLLILWLQMLDIVIAHHYL